MHLLNVLSVYIRLSRDTGCGEIVLVCVFFRVIFCSWFENSGVFSTDDYEILIDNLEQFATTLLEYVRNGEEIDTALWAGEEDDNERLPPRLTHALHLDFKRVSCDSKHKMELRLRMILKNELEYE